MTKRPDRAPRGGGRRASPERERSIEDDARARSRAPLATGTGNARAAQIVWLGLALLWIARAALAFSHGMALWAVNLQRFLAPVLAWSTWLIAAAALVPPVARRALPAFARLGNAIARRPALTTSTWMAGAALLAWVLPDRVRFVGDFLLRQGAIEENVRPAAVFPQALPLDVFLHVRTPALLMTALGLDAAHAARLVGAAEAAVLAAIAVAFARALETRGAAAVAVTCTVLFGGYLALYTGYSKSLIELALLTGAVGLFAVRALRTGRGLVPLGVCLALGALLHRSALGFVPAFVLVLAWSLARAPRRVGAVALAALLPVAAFAAMGARIAATLTHGDVAVHLASDEVVRGGGLLGTMFAGARGLDLLDLVALLSPVALTVPFAVPALGGRARSRELLVLLVLAAPFVVLMLLIHPAQGMFRDWDDFAETGIALSLLAAWVVAEALRATPREQWIAVAVAVAVAMATIQWLAHQTDTPRGLARVRAFLEEPPPRTDAERGKTWDYLGVREYRLEHWDAAARAFGEAARTVPSPRILSEWAAAELQRGDYAAARTAYERVVARDSADVFAWTQLAGVAMQQGDTTTMRRAAVAILKVRPDDPDGLGILRVLANGGRMPGR